jgi:hypothetical protein
MSFNWDPIGKVVIELRDDAGVMAIVGANPTDARGRVRGAEAGPDDVQGPGEYRAFVLVRGEGTARDRRVPVQRARVVAKCFGRSYAEASQLAAAVSSAMHDRGVRTHNNGLGIWKSFADTDGGQDTDPDTRQPFVDVFIDLIATTQAVA